MLWIDKYKPTSLDQMDYHKDISENLKNMILGGDFPHLLVYGPSGAGKKTRVMATLKEIYGANCLKVKIENKTFKHPSSSKSIQVTTVSSPYHIEINPGEAGSYDRLVIQSIIKDIAQSPPIDSQSFVVILNEVDKLSKDAQHALRRTMEKYANFCRLILCCDSTSKVIDPIRSRCMGIRVPAPTKEEIVKVLQNVAKKERFDLSAEVAGHFAERSNGNLRYALLLLESKKTKEYPFQTNELPLLDWESAIFNVANDMITEQSPARLQVIRGKLYELIGHCIPPDIIMKNLTFALLERIDTTIKYDIIHWAAFYEQNQYFTWKHSLPSLWQSLKSSKWNFNHNITST
ncbi:replication factor C subunit [Heterostelium album PN500]|uniref:Replication factor C subunit n=1 Tax=Heterostelium pallidum (strain ATCC 26659 / Pp 5 / PN500) TaxID=670386 RepID=D3BK44_HETP5|nr:replication factor C subunit [Heterostelium album PN500]EFA78274.1 replication factor C subunit [Heterostelium album PN500]|eukprot:XP_020430399.1 replication factor C subunit [Heterostelium album PN500]